MILHCLTGRGQEHGLRVRSYTVELLTIHAFRSAGGVSSTLSLFQDVPRLLRGWGSLAVAFDDNYNSREFTRSVSSRHQVSQESPPGQSGVATRSVRSRNYNSREITRSVSVASTLLGTRTGRLRVRVSAL